MRDENILPPSRVMSIPPSSLELHSPVWRVFCAIDLPQNARGQLLAHIKRLREAAPHAQASWSRAESIHLTLKFFGDIEEGQVERLSAAASRVTHRYSIFQIGLGGPGAFPPRGTPRVLWIGVNDPSGQLTDLQQQYENECAKEGFPKEERSFRPHLTLARLRKPQGSRALADIHKGIEFRPVEVSVSELVLFRSELSNEGSKYTVISRHGLEAQRTGS
jgi:RNA 2',3'-cyclic 3'-phosphodiesterase